MEYPGDDKIVRLCQKNGREGFELLFERYRRYIYTICFRSTRNEQDALDLTQDVLWRIVRSIGRFDPKKPLTPWIRRIAVNVCINHARAPDRAQATDLLDPDNGIPEAVDDNPDRSPEKHQQRTESKKRIGEALATLPGPERTALILRHMEDRSYAEIAKMMEAPEGSVKTWIFRGRRMVGRQGVLAAAGRFPVADRCKGDRRPDAPNPWSGACGGSCWRHVGSHCEMGRTDNFPVDPAETPSPADGGWQLMLSILGFLLLGILKLLIGILLLVLFLLFLVLVIPFRYECNGHRYEENLEATGTADWLSGLVSVVVSYDQVNGFRVRLMLFSRWILKAIVDGSGNQLAGKSKKTSEASAEKKAEK